MHLSSGYNICDVLQWRCPSGAGEQLKNVSFNSLDDFLTFKD